MKPIQMVDLKSQYQELKEKIDSGIQNVIDNTAFINGPQVKEFASNLEAYLDVKHVITCGNGTDAPAAEVSSATCAEALCNALRSLSLPGPP